MDKDNLFPQIKKGIEDFMKEEEGNISRSGNCQDSCQ